ncbi:cyclase family protein [Paraburkholderia xenovorans]|uniref:cyclase family protein n=1 Tax=Paraburkholderia xenovorans TaxID=36873 RepID=UPI0038BDF25A
MYIDLTLSIDQNDPVIGKASKDPNSYMSQGHIGTHLDVNFGHALPPAEYCRRRGWIVDVSGVSHAEIDESVLSGIDWSEGDFIMFHTGRTAEYRYGSPEYFKEHPQLNWTSIHSIAKRKPAFIGLDFAGLRRGPEHNQADSVCAEHGTYVIENLARLGELVERAGARPFEVVTGWTGLVGATGLSCRVTAIVK